MIKFSYNLTYLPDGKMDLSQKSCMSIYDGKNILTWQYFFKVVIIFLSLLEICLE